MIFFFGEDTLRLQYPKKKLIHAYGPAKKTVFMKTDYAIKRILKTANLSLLTIKRI